ncbi:TcpQ domain-containing protein [Pantoea sp. PNA 03-3]|uniref:PFGI-1 class ICE element type IV pilus protein PilL2 n=1 Tax=Pantoea sp. PNA 03-3 TaxID=2135460 RepID=UPI000D764448|nr:TcpQ domain-containing protein [Pantoea sp. PNA 03-3]PXV76811.1 type IV pili sensor histidine kinase/response regulator [Pantoea sp. PNA 03-3]
MAVPSGQAAKRVGIIACTVMLAGCVNAAATDNASVYSRSRTPARFDDIYRNRSPEVVRYDRYTLVSTRPADAQLDPLNQVVDITMPAQLVSTVGEGFRYLLLESGYSLCSATTAAFSELLSRPLPAVQRTIGPLKLSEALQVVAGPAWRLKVDEVNREVCFELRDQYRSFSAPAASLPAIRPAVSAPVPRPYATPVVQTKAVSVQTPASGLARKPFTGDVVTPSGLKPQSLSVPSPVLQQSQPSVSSGNITASSQKPAPLASAGTAAAAHTTAQQNHVVITPAAVKTKTAPLTTVNATPKAASVVHQQPSTAVTPAPAADSRIVPTYSTGTLVTPPATGQTWRAEPGTTLKEALTAWAAKAPCANGGNWVLIWPVTLDYRIDAPLVFHGNFESVLVQVFDLYRHAEKPLFAEANRIQCLVSVSDTPTPGGR